MGGGKWVYGGRLNTGKQRIVKAHCEDCYRTTRHYASSDGKLVCRECLKRNSVPLCAPAHNPHVGGGNGERNQGVGLPAQPRKQGNADDCVGHGVGWGKKHGCG